MTRASIKNEQEYEAALEAIEQRLDAEPGTLKVKSLRLWQS